MEQYEFSESQNRVFLRISDSLRRFATTLGIFAIFLLFVGIIFGFRGDPEFTDSYGAVAGSVGISIVGVIALFLCFRFLQPLYGIRSITNTTEQDISHLLDGIGNLNQAHRLLRIMLLLFLISAALVYWRMLT